MGRGVPQGLQAGLPSLGCYVDSPAGDLMPFGSTGQGSPGGYIENMLSNEQNMKKRMKKKDAAQRTWTKGFSRREMRCRGK